MKVELQDIPGLADRYQTVHRVKTLAINGRNRAKSALIAWRRDCEADWRKLVKAIKFVGTHERREIRNCKYVKKCDNPRHGDVYELRAHQGKPRLFFFYDSSDNSVVICTNSYEKDDSGRMKTAGQDAAFARCADLRALYERSIK